jgi:hypothetical protein
MIQNPNMLKTQFIDPNQGKHMQNHSYPNHNKVFLNQKNVQCQPINKNINIIPNYIIFQNKFVYNPLQIPQLPIPNMLDQQQNQFYQGFQSQNKD